MESTSFVLVSREAEVRDLSEVFEAAGRNRARPTSAFVGSHRKSDGENSSLTKNCGSISIGGSMEGAGEIRIGLECRNPRPRTCVRCANQKRGDVISMVSLFEFYVVIVFWLYLLLIKVILLRAVFKVHD